MRQAKFLRALAIFSAAYALSLPPAHAQTAQQGDAGFSLEMNRPAAWYLEQNQKISLAIGALQPERPGTVDAYVVVAGLDSDDVFGRETAETSKVLSQRFDAAGRTVTLSAGSGAGVAAQAHASAANLMATLAAVAAKMNKTEDVLVLYTTSHGGPGFGVVFKDGEQGVGLMSGIRLAQVLDELGIQRRVIMISACYSGAFVPPLQSDESIVVTAASSERSSFGCQASNDWTFFGDALVNSELRKPVAFEKSVAAAFKTISGWESKYKLTPSEPQFFIGSAAKVWMTALEARMPKTASARVGKPATADMPETEPSTKTSAKKRRKPK